MTEDEPIELRDDDPVANAYHEASHVVMAEVIGFGTNPHIVSVTNDPHMDLGITAADFPYLDENGLTRSGLRYLGVLLAGRLGQAVFVGNPESGRFGPHFTRMLNRLAELGWTPRDSRDPCELLANRGWEEPLTVEELGDDGKLLGLLARYGSDDALPLIRDAEDAALEVLGDHWSRVEELAQEALLGLGAA